MAPRVFTPAQANRALPLVRRIVAELLAQGRTLRELKARAGGPADLPLAGRLEAEIVERMEELERIGCSYKDWSFEVGLVDFPSEIGGRPVLLCWRSDEESVGFYHAPEAGFAGRRPIAAELPEEQA